LKTPPRIVRSEVLLTAVAKCGECGAPLRKLSGKGRTYHYYRCSKKFESGVAACKGVSIPMGELDEIVLGALEETVLEPKRLRKMTEALVSRASERNEAFAARQKQLDGERSKTQVMNLYRLLGTGELTTDPTLTAHIRELQEKVETLNRQIAHLDRERSLPVERIGAEAVEGFGRAVSAALRSLDNRAFARAYVQALITDVTVSDREVKISGPKAALLHQTALFAAKGELVPSFAQEWRTRSEKVRTGISKQTASLKP
jgi:site-specific DNA recombinase